LEWHIFGVDIFTNTLEYVTSQKKNVPEGSYHICFSLSLSLSLSLLIHDHQQTTLEVLNAKIFDSTPGVS
jgi:hypothetical protein